MHQGVHISARNEPVYSVKSSCDDALAAEMVGKRLCFLIVIFCCVSLQQYWAGDGAYQYVSPAQMREFFSKHALGQALETELAVTLEKTEKGVQFNFTFRFCGGGEALSEIFTVFL